MHIPRIRQLSLAWLLSLLSVFFLTPLPAAQAAQSGADAEARALGIEIYTPSTSDLFVELFCDEIRRLAAPGGLNVSTFESDSNADRQSELMQRNLRRYVPAIVRPVDPHRADEMVNLAQKRQTTVVLFNLPPEPGVIDSYENAWYIGSDPKDAGQIQAEIILEYLKQHQNCDRNGNGVLDIMLLRGRPDNEDAVYRTAAVTAALDNAGIKYQLTDDYTANWFFSEAYSHAREMITTGQIKDIDIVISNNDDMALGVIEAIEHSDEFTAGRTDYLPTFGFDLVPDAEAALLRDALSGTVMQDYRTMARLALEICKGETDPAHLGRLAGTDVSSRTILLHHKPVRKADIISLLRGRR